MTDSNQTSDQQLANIFEICREIHREAYPQSPLDFDRLDLTACITPGTEVHARGKFSDVYKGKIDDRIVVAVKTLRLPVYTPYNDSIYQTALRRFFREINIWSTKEHPNVAPCLGYTLTGANISLISPWHENGSLVEFLQRSPGASEPDLILDVAEGTQYLHTCSNPLIHGDLKGANVLVNEHGIGRLADFGISKQVDDMNRKTGFTTTSGVRGTMPWMAPELLREPSLTFPCDVYSCGGVFLEICCPGKRPYHYLEDLDLFREKVTGTPPDLAHYPEIAGKAPLWGMMCACWAQDPLNRPNMTDVVRSLYCLFKLSPRVSQTVTLRPAANSRTGDDGGTALERLSLDPLESEPGENGLLQPSPYGPPQMLIVLPAAPSSVPYSALQPTSTSDRQHPGGTPPPSTAITVSNLPTRRRGRPPQPATETLNSWLMNHRDNPYPTEEEKQQLSNVTNLTVEQVTKRMMNGRRRFLAPGSKAVPGPAISSASSAPYNLGHRLNPPSGIPFRGHLQTDHQPPSSYPGSGAQYTPSQSAYSSQSASYLPVPPLRHYLSSGGSGNGQYERSLDADTRFGGQWSEMSESGPGLGPEREIDSPMRDLSPSRSSSPFDGSGSSDLLGAGDPNGKLTTGQVIAIGTEDEPALAYSTL